MRSASSFTFEPLFVVLGIAALVAYGRAWRREGAGIWHALAFGGGVVLIVAALNSPLETIAIDYLVLFHLLQNVIIADWAPPLLILGLTPAMRRAIAARGGRPFAVLTRPTVALPVWLVGWYVVHLGGVYDVALRNPWLLNVEHLFMISIGLIFWWPVFSDEPESVPTLGRIAYVFAAFVLSAFLGLALTFAPPLYGYYESLPDAALGHLGREGPEPRRHPDDHRAGADPLRRGRLAPRAIVPRGGRGGGTAAGGAARAGVALGRLRERRVQGGTVRRGVHRRSQFRVALLERGGGFRDIGEAGSHLISHRLDL